MEITATQTVLLLFITLMEALGNYQFCLITPASLPRLMDATSEASYSDPCRRVIKPPLREVGTPIHHGCNEMKMKSISFSLTNAVRGSTIAVSEGSRGHGKRVEVISFLKLLCCGNSHSHQLLYYPHFLDLHTPPDLCRWRI